MKKSKTDTWTFKIYTIRQIMPSTGFVAVFAMEAETKGKYVLETIPIDLLALADVIEKTVEGIEGVGGIEVDSESFTEVVGLELCEGWFEVCNDSDNFAGLCRVGDDISKVTGFLASKYSDNLETTSPK